jgi:ribosome biogenesis protein ERB1
LIHSISKASSQRPFSTTKGIIQAIAFHPSRPHFFAATHTTVFQYNLQKQSIVQKYKSGAKWISSISMHRGGDNFVLGTYDKKVLWFDMDMSGDKPYKSLKYQSKAIRDVQFSPKWPLFASASDDGTVNVFYGQVYSDLMSDPLVVPVKVLKAHAPDQRTGLGAMQCAWHPLQPWIVTAGGDGKVTMWV